MPSTAQSINSISEQEYLEGEKLREIKHEYIDGHVYAMAGSSKRHNLITGNISFTFWCKGHSMLNVSVRYES